MAETRGRIESLAAGLGARADVVEKVVRLLAVLQRLREDEDLRDRIAPVAGERSARAGNLRGVALWRNVGTCA